MGGSVIGALRVVLGIDPASFETGLKQAKKEMRSAGRAMQDVGKTMAGVGAGLSLAITAPLIAAGFAASKAATESRDAMGQVEAALKSMGDQAGQTKDSLAGMATDIMRNSLYDDDDVLRKVTANMLTFGKIAGDEFRRAQIAAVDLATRMGTDLQSATILVGKALNDPVRGLGALRKAGVQLDEGQQALVKSMVATGDVAGAQRILLGELEAQFGGSAKAAQDTDPYDSLRDSLNDLSESMGAIINEHIKPLIDGLNTLARTFNGLSPQVQKFAVAGLAIAAALGPALVVIGSVVQAIGALSIAFASGGVLAGLAGFALAAVPFIAAAVAIGAAIWAFRDDLIPIFDEFKTAVMDALGPMLPGVIESAKAAFAALGPAIKALVGFLGPILAGLAEIILKTFGPIVVTMVRVLAAGIGNAFTIIAQTLKMFSRLLSGDFSGAWNAFGSLIKEVALGVMRIIDAVFPGTALTIAKMVTAVRRLLTVDLGQAFEWVKTKAKEVGDAFFHLYDRVVGHSYVPDMVDEIGQQMARLEQVMNDPVDKATKSATERFAQLREDARDVMQGLLTDQERLNLDYLKARKRLTDAIALGGPQADTFRIGLQRLDAKYQRDSAGIAAQDLKPYDAPDLSPIEDLPAVKSVMTTLQAMQDAVAQSRDAFAEAFSSGMQAAVRGDWRGVLEAVVGDSFNDALKNLGRWFFDKMGGSSPGGFSFGNIGSLVSSVAGVFGGVAPKFKDGGSIVPGGAGGADSQFVQFWKSPSERVDIYRPGQDGGPGGGGAYFDLRGAVMTQDLLNQMNRIGQGAEDRAHARSMREAPALAMSQMAQKQMHALGRRAT